MAIQTGLLHQGMNVVEAGAAGGRIGGDRPQHGRDVGRHRLVVGDRQALGQRLSDELSGAARNLTHELTQKIASVA